MALNASGISYTETGWESREGLEVADITTPGRERTSGVEIFFLPEVKSFKDDAAFREQVSSTYAVPSFFWKRAGYDANGFCSYNQVTLPDDQGTIYSTSSRFLIKEIFPNQSEEVKDYGWQFMAFVSMWFKPNSGQAATHVLLCFDLSSKMKTLIQNAFRESTPRDWRGCPFGSYTILAPVIAEGFDDALWAFRRPIRKFENLRKDKLEGDQTHEELDPESVASQYRSMHEVARHIIHEDEVLDVTAATLDSIAKHNNYFCSVPNAALSSCIHNLEFYQNFMRNLQKRASAFDKRLHNEITLAFNISAASANYTSKEILWATRNDGRDLTNLVSTLTILFLPGTFFSGFFGMNFFDYGDEYVGLSRSVWIFFILTAPVTIVAFLAWGHFRKKSEKAELPSSSDHWPNNPAKFGHALIHQSTMRTGPLAV